MKKINLKNIIILFILFISLQGAGYCTPALKEIDSTIDTINLYIYKGYIQKKLPYVTYTVRTKDKNMGDYINIVKTNCNTMDTGIVSSLVFDKNYYPTYNFDTQVELTPINSNALLYNAAKLACSSNDTYTKTKQNASSEKDGIPMKILKGTGKTIGFILVLPFAILGALLG